MKMMMSTLVKLAPAVLAACLGCASDDACDREVRRHYKIIVTESDCDTQAEVVEYVDGKPKVKVIVYDDEPVVERETEYYYYEQPQVYYRSAPHYTVPAPIMVPSYGYGPGYGYGGYRYGRYGYTVPHVGIGFGPYKRFGSSRGHGGRSHGGHGSRGHGSVGIGFGPR